MGNLGNFTEHTSFYPKAIHGISFIAVPGYTILLYTIATKWRDNGGGVFYVFYRSSA